MRFDQGRIRRIGDTRTQSPISPMQFAAASEMHVPAHQAIPLSSMSTRHQLSGLAMLVEALETQAFNALVPDR